MYNSFISIVTVIEDHEEAARLPEYLKLLHQVMQLHFSDHEIILVNNTPGRSLDLYIDPLPTEVKQNIYLLNLSSPVNKNHALVAGLDRANGDYTLIFEMEFYLKPELALSLFEQSAQGFDIVYLRAKGRQTAFRNKLFYKIFYWILKSNSQLDLDEKAHDTRIISRRALNSLLRMRENLRYMKAIYSLVGYRRSFIEIDQPLPPDPSSFTEKFRTSLVAITSFTSFLRNLLLWIFLMSILFMAIVIFNAIKVKLTNLDMFGNYHDAIPGWTFLVVISSIFFAITCLMLYIMSIYLSNIYQEIKHRPMYIIESVKRF